jgi:hypothetical protein
MESFSKDLDIKEESNESSSSSYHPNINYSDSLNLDSNLDESSWSIEEEFLFFEGHYIIGNKWTFLCQLFPDRTPKQMKNHFYSSIVKTLRKVLRNRIELNLKDTIVTYYSIIYVKALLKNLKFLISKNKKKDSDDNKNVTLKKLILNHNINFEMINNYQIKFEEFLRIQIKKLYKINIDISNLRINNIFKEIIKMEILIKSSKIFHSNILCYNDSIKIFDFFSKTLTNDFVNTFIIKKNKNH